MGVRTTTTHKTSASSRTTDDLRLTKPSVVSQTFENSNVRQQQCVCSIIANHLGLWCRIWQTSNIYSSKLSHVSVPECPNLHHQILKWTQKPGSLTPSHCFPSSEEFWSEHFTFEHSAFLCDLYVTSGKAKPGFTVKAWWLILSFNIWVFFIFLIFCTVQLNLL